ncbi:CaiB/BaiF CoA transferase family protein [Microbacterium trichothecenolyticum]|uniref:CaiB/BaiF CoA transferase family protein n=1 Tax=Microbacterium trichothecenolyticum TaxID=69370 RepID=UPI0027E33A41|nr:CaiB/BaiF CoA-transferase family protein [Microbacterium trichothecenolyticum]
MSAAATGPLAGVRVVEFAALGPAPLGSMFLADLGADVIRIDRPSPVPGVLEGIEGRGKRSIALDLKSPDDLAIARALIAQADVLIEGYRPGVMEKLGLGPDDVAADRPQLIYARMTGWGQDGPYSDRPGHDTTFIAYTGILAASGPADGAPTLGGNYLEMGGGANLLVIGVLAALLERHRSGRGQVIDAAIIDGTSLLATGSWGGLAAGWWSPGRANNLWDGGAPFYKAYETSDSKWIILGALEPKFYDALVEALDLPEWRDRQHDRSIWPEMEVAFAAQIRQRPRDEWAALLADSCGAAVLDWNEAADDAHIRARGTIVDFEGVRQPAPAPRFSRTPAQLTTASPSVDAHRDQILHELQVLCGADDNH